MSGVRDGGRWAKIWLKKPEAAKRLSVLRSLSVWLMSDHGTGIDSYRSQGKGRKVTPFGSPGQPAAVGSCMQVSRIKVSCLSEGRCRDGSKWCCAVCISLPKAGPR